MIWGFTGTRKGMTEKQKAALKAINRGAVSNDEFHHGDCIGADAEAFEIVQYSYWIHAHPSNIVGMGADTDSDERHPIKEPLARSYDIADVCDVLIAAPCSLQEEQRSGTWATIRYARKLGKPVIILEP
jgi:hypothetical protein